MIEKYSDKPWDFDVFWIYINQNITLKMIKKNMKMK